MRAKSYGIVAMHQREIRFVLEIASQRKLPVLLTRTFDGDSKPDGYVLGIGAQWVLLQSFYNFFPDGFELVRVDQLASARSGEIERHYHEMYVGEGLTDRPKLSFEVALDTTEELFETLLWHGDHVIIECESLREAIANFHIGKLLHVNGDTARLAHFDALGNWDTAIHTIQLGEVTRIRIDSNYTRVYSKYLSGPCPHPYS
jgi:hypothetical protein